MNNKELKELLNSITPTKAEKEQMNNVVNTINQLIKNSVSSNVKIAALEPGGSFRKGTILRGRKEVDIVVSVSPKNKLMYKDLANFCMNYIENVFYSQYYEKLKELEPSCKIKRNYERNTLSLLTTNGVNVDFLIKFNASQLQNMNIRDIENFYLERDKQQLDFIKYANEEFTKYKESVMLTKHFRDICSLSKLKSYMIEIVMYYSLVKYLNDGTDYTDYLDAFFKGLNDFNNKKLIQVSDKMYAKLMTNNGIVPNNPYRVIDVANKTNNVAMYIKDSDIKEFKSFYEKYKNEFKEIPNQLKSSSQYVNCTIECVWRDNYSEVCIKSQVEGLPSYATQYFKNECDTTLDDAIDYFYKHLLRIIRMINRHNLSKNIKLKCSSQLADVYNRGQMKTKSGQKNLNSKQNDRIVQLKQRLKKEGFKITFD